jgi:hypothetical protein
LQNLRRRRERRITDAKKNPLPPPEKGPPEKMLGAAPLAQSSTLESSTVG